MPRRLWPGLLLLACLAGCGAPEDDLGRIGDFSLIERSGQRFDRGDLNGKVWVASFVFTRCAGPCATVTRSMANLQDAFAAVREIRLVTFTVDPEHDTPAVLSQYAERNEARTGRWFFLTGERDSVYRMIYEDFHLHAKPNEGAERTAGNEVAHDTRLVLVDGQGRIRGYWSGTEPDQLRPLVEQARALALPYRLPTFNALLNGTCAVLLLLGYLAVRRRWLATHKALMIMALLVSAVFLASYLYYHFAVRGGEPTRFKGPDGVRLVYLGILLSHTVLAGVVAPLALFTAWKGLRNQLAGHTRIARWTLPIWLYVSVTGVVIYVMLYQLYPS